MGVDSVNQNVEFRITSSSRGPLDMARKLRHPSTAFISLKEEACNPFSAQILLLII